MKLGIELLFLKKNFREYVANSSFYYYYYFGYSFSGSQSMWCKSRCVDPYLRLQMEGKRITKGPSWMEYFKLWHNNISFKHCMANHRGVKLCEAKGRDTENIWQMYRTSRAVFTHNLALSGSLRLLRQYLLSLLQIRFFFNCLTWSFIYEC